MGDRSTRWTRARLIAATAAGTTFAAVILGAVGSPGSPRGTVQGPPASAHLLGDKWGDPAADAVSKDPITGHYDPGNDPGSMYNMDNAIGATNLWNDKDPNGRAITGQGVTVALIDSGVSAVAGLNSPGKILTGPDLSLETNSAGLQNVDTFGHGTHLAGIIAAHDPTTVDAHSGAPTGLNPTTQMGVAPDARVLAVKVATTDGSSDVSQIIAALDWVTEHKTDNGMNVKVINLSFGTDSLQAYQLDPLAAAAENAWHHGIVVVVSGGNEGAAAGRLTDPAIDPYVIAVGAADPSEKQDYKHLSIAPFSSVGNAQRHVDLIAPGTSIASFADPGSFVASNYPGGYVAGDNTGRLFRGSGTSQAAAVVSGSVALLEQADPGITPDQIKAVLMGTAQPIKHVSALAQGAGEIDLQAAYQLTTAYRTGKISATVAAPAQAFPVATGNGSIDMARGGDHLVDPVTGSVLAGEVDVQGNPWNAAAWDATSVAGTAWSGGNWLGTQYTGTGWTSARWSSARWSSARWSGASWQAANWSSARWSSARWSSARWSGATW